MGSFAGLLTGIGDAMHQGHLEDTQNAITQKQTIMDLYGKLLQSPEFEEAHPEILQSYLGLAGTPTDKLPKAIKQYSDLNTVLGPALQRAQARQQSQPVAPPPVMGSPQNAPQSPVAGPPVGMDSLNPMIQTPPGMPAGPLPGQPGAPIIGFNGPITPPPAQVAAQADAVGQSQGALPGVNTVVPPSAAGASVPNGNGLPPEPVKPLAPRWMDPEAWRRYEGDSKAYDDLKKAVLTHQLERGQMTDDRKKLMESVGIPPTAEGMAKATPEQLRMLEFMAGGNPGTSRKDLITLSPGQTLYDPNAGKTVATGADKPPNEQQVKDLQLAAYYAHLTGADPAKMDDTAKAFARKLSEVRDDFVQSALEAQVANVKRILTPQEWNATVKIAEKQKADNLRPVTPEPGSWSLQEDGKGNSVAFNNKTHEVVPVSGVQKTGTAAKAAAADEKAQGPARDAIAYADDYLKNGSGPVGPDGKPLNGKVEYTGAGDEALMEKFFDLAKPSSGFRMSQPQIDMLKNAQGWQNSIAAKARHVTTGTWFSDQQRNQIVSTIKQIARTKGSAPAAVSPPPGTTSVIKVQKWGRDAQGNPVPIQ